MPIRFFVWFAILFSALFGMVELRYLIGSQEVADWQPWQYAFFSAYGLGYLFLEALLFFVLTGLIAFLARLRKTTLFWVALAGFLFGTYILADTFVYGLYRTHINWVMLKMAFLGKGQIINFTAPMIAQIVLLIGLCAAAISVVTGLAWVISKRKYRLWPWVAVFVSLFLGTNFVYGISFSKQFRQITSIPEYLPLSYPITFNKQLERFGFLTAEDKAKAHLSQRIRNGKMKYPLKPLQCKPAEKKLNIVFIWVDALRADMLNGENMPHTSRFAQGRLVFNNHYSTGNNTRHGVFGLFTGLPGTYWTVALHTGTPSILTTALQDNGYRVGVFAGAPLTMPEFHTSIFSNIADLRIEARGNNSLERDRFAIDDFESWVQKDKGPFFSFLFLDNVHGYEWPDKAQSKFQPYWDKINHLELNNDFDPAPYFNNYKNAVFWADQQIQRVLDFLEKEKLLDKTIVVISSDHGEEFNDNRQNYWGHGGNFSPAQVKIPLIIHWPGKSPQTVTCATSAADIVPTLLTEALGCQNPTTDYSVGASLFGQEVCARPFVYVDGWDRRAFIDAKRINIINKVGLLEHKTHDYQKATDQSMPDYFGQVFEDNHRFLQ